MEGSGNGESRERESKKARGWGKTPSTGLEKCWLPICNRLRTRPEVVEPEIWFRFVHLAQAGHSGAPVAAYREQMVEIALGGQGGVRKRQFRRPDATSAARSGGKRCFARPW